MTLSALSVPLTCSVPLGAMVMYNIVNKRSAASSIRLWLSLVLAVNMLSHTTSMFTHQRLETDETSQYETQLMTFFDIIGMNQTVTCNIRHTLYLSSTSQASSKPGIA